MEQKCETKFIHQHSKIGKCKNNGKHILHFLIINLACWWRSFVFVHRKWRQQDYKLSDKWELPPFTRRLHHCRSSFISFNVIHDPTPRPRCKSREGKRTYSEEVNADRKHNGCFSLHLLRMEHIYNPPPTTTPSECFKQGVLLFGITSSPGSVGYRRVYK